LFLKPLDTTAGLVHTVLFLKPLDTTAGLVHTVLIHTSFSALFLSVHFGAIRQHLANP
jgi:hypothetical protein